MPDGFWGGAVEVGPHAHKTVDRSPKLWLRHVCVCVFFEGAFWGWKKGVTQLKWRSSFEVDRTYKDGQGRGEFDPNQSPDSPQKSEEETWLWLKLRDTAASQSATGSPKA